jgi:hypothetical protein
VLADSLPCLEYAHVHACPQEEHIWWPCYDFQGRSLPVLRYVCEHLGPALAAKTLEDTAGFLSYQVESFRRVIHESENRVDWSLVLYIERKLGEAALPKALAETRARRMKRAAALAGVFWKAGKQLCAEEARLVQVDVASGEESRKITCAEESSKITSAEESSKITCAEESSKITCAEESSKITCADAERMAVWDAMSQVPSELQELIAVKAYLVMR